MEVGNLGFFLSALAEAWLGRGVGRQVAAFRGGLGDMAALDRGLLAFELQQKVAVAAAGEPDIAAKLNVAVESVAPLRSSLIKKGMVYSPAHGDTAFTVPMFDEFLDRQKSLSL